MKKVCIIVPIYNVSKFIERCARSLFEQIFENIQYVFVNDCTPDNSVEILERVIADYPNRKEYIKIIHHDINKGLGAARKTGILNANAEFVLNVDSDDFVELNMVELMYNKTIEENADIVVCDFLMDWGKATKIFPQIYSSNNVEYTKLLLSGKAMPGVVNKLIRLSLYTKNNIMPVEGINMGEDYLITPRLAYFANKIAKVDLPLYHYVQLNENAYTKSFSKKSVDNLIQVLDILNIFFTNISDRELYHQSLLEGRLNKKILLLMQSDSRTHKELVNLFPETDSILGTATLNIEERITIYLANKKLFLMLNIFLFLCYTLIEFVQILKGRRRKF
jgi:Glycosyltransferases involved in cell wall biogenesis